MEIKEELRLKLGGSDDIQIDTLTEVLKGTLETLKSLSDDIVDEGGYRNFVVKNVTKGSFILEIWSIISSNPQTSIFYATSALAAFKTFLDIKKHLKGSQPAETTVINGNVTIKNTENEIIIVNQVIYDKFSTDGDIDAGIQRIFRALDKDNTRPNVDFEVKTDNLEESTVSVSSNEYKAFTKPINLTSTNNSLKEDTFEANIRLSKIDFTGDTKWSIYVSGGVKETATLVDSIFIDDVKAGKYLFGTSTTMKARILSKYQVNENGLPIEGKRRELTILEVLEVYNKDYDIGSLFN